jgi:hypothetical protein
MRRFLIFGLLGPVLAYFSIEVATRTVARWWWPQPSIYAVAIAPFLLTAFIDGTLKNARIWERLIVAGITTFFASGLACAVVYRELGASMFGFYAALPAVACSLLATASDVAESTPVE